MDYGGYFGNLCSTHVYIPTLTNLRINARAYRIPWCPNLDKRVFDVPEMEALIEQTHYIHLVSGKTLVLPVDVICFLSHDDMTLSLFAVGTGRRFVFSGRSVLFVVLYNGNVDVS